MTAELPQRFLLVLTNCTDPARLEEFDRWYTDVHVPDVVETDGIVRGTRYRLTTPPREGQAQFLAVYELAAGEDPNEVGRRLREHMAGKRAEGRIMDCLEAVVTGTYEQVSDLVKAPGGNT